MRAMQVLLSCAVLAMLGACAMPPAHGTDADRETPLPLTDVVQPKLAPQPAIDPTLSQPLAERRCDFRTELDITPDWFSGRDQLTADGRIALARGALGPTSVCQKIELVSITVVDDGAVPPALAQHVNERRAEDIRRFFSSRGISPERIEAIAGATDGDAACKAATGKPCSAHVSVWVRGVAR